MLMLSLYIGIYYNFLISWSFFYLFSSFTSSLPWATCDNEWNTPNCTVFDRETVNLTTAAPTMATTLGNLSADMTTMAANVSAGLTSVVSSNEYKTDPVTEFWE